MTKPNVIVAILNIYPLNKRYNTLHADNNWVKQTEKSYVKHIKSFVSSINLNKKKENISERNPG